MKTSKEVIAYMASVRDTPYPEEMSNEALLDVLNEVLDCLMEGKAAPAISGLASLIDVLQHLPKKH